MVNVSGKSEVYKCSVCGNVVEVLVAGGGELVCCGQPMELLAEKTEDEGNEKHVPVVSVDGDKVTVKVGSVPHPMEEQHYISLIEVLAGGEVLASYRPSPGEKPEAEFCIKGAAEHAITAREYCTVHGLWKSK